MAGLRIELFGGFRVLVGHRAVPDGAWSRRKPAALVKLLALAPGYRLRREQVMDVLWPELEPAAAAANLRKALHAARRALDGDGLSADGAALIESIGDLLCLRSDGLSVDVAEYRAAAALARQSRDASIHWAALDLYRDGLLPEDRYEDWAAGPRDELHADWTALATELARVLEERGEFNEAARVVNRLVAGADAAADTVQEENHVRLMRLYALAGRRDEARRQYERLRAALHAELGVEPSPRAQRLYEEIRGGHTAEPDLAVELWEKVGDLRAQSGDADGAGKAYEQALRASNEPASTGRLHRRMATALLMGHQTDAAADHLAKADALGPDTAERGRLACVRAHLAWEHGDLGAARDLADEAHETAREHGDDEDIVDALEALAIISHLRGDWRAGLQAQVRRLSGTDLGGQVSRYLEINHCAGQYQLYGDALAGDVGDYARQTLALAERCDAVAVQAFAWCLLGESLLLAGHWGEADACLARSCELYTPMGSRTVALPWLRRAELAVCTGAFEDAAAHLRWATAIATVAPSSRHAWARLHGIATLAALEQGDLDAAVAAVTAARETASRYGDCPSCGAMLNPLAAETLARTGDLRGAREFAAIAERTAESFDSTAWQAMASSAAAWIAVGEGDRAAAREGFEAAAAAFDKAGHPYWTARARRQAGGVE
ncbi:BTAD domain-containing putative transcriptional regulator [Frankia canadensis]|uniref:BTAD domain-containing putative transcriptional regulator n=1 Tax=Frankia canadensis TaxID=1836972 RepID=UPI000C7E7AEB|nr:BTAD domain-containing putative transcriptional regulator [Frankia canadensis]